MSNALFLGDFLDEKYSYKLKHMFGGVTTYTVFQSIDMLTHLEMYCLKRNVTKVATTNVKLLAKLVEMRGGGNSKPKLSDYAGSLFKYNGIEILFIDPLAQLQTVSYGSFLTARYISKLVAPHKWSEPTKFQWAILDAANIESFYLQFQSAYAISVDIETFKTNLAIRCVSFTGIFIGRDNSISTYSVVLPLDSEWALAWCRKFCKLSAAKIFQNGKYDNAYLLRYNSAPTNWLWDTAHLMHSWYSELPKDLGFLNAFFLREVVYWKDLSETTDLFEYYKYNALDGWATANVWIQQMLQLPEWARRNYFLEFPLVFPCLLSELTGLVRDPVRHLESRKEVEDKIAPAQSFLNNVVSPGFNSNSPPQVMKLVNLLGNKGPGGKKIIESTGEKELDRFKFRHPIAGLLLGKVLDIRGWRKLIGTYLRLDEDKDKETDENGGAKEYKGFYLYSLNPHGTDSGRLASKSSAFWCGGNVQNIPTRDGPVIKRTFRAPEGFYIAESDLKQAETWDMAHISGDKNLLAAVYSPKDFHSVNVEAFFGLPYDTVYDDAKGKAKNKPIRDISKRTNHGANYNMGEFVLANTMGMENVYKAKTLLKLPFHEPVDITGYLLGRFHITYSGIRGPIKIKSENVRKYLNLPPCENKFYAPGTFYAAVAMEVTTSKLLVSRAYHHTAYNLRTYPDAESYISEGDWTRYCFGKPTENKLDLNSVVAHPAQSLNARTLNEAYMEVFYHVALPNPTTFRLNAQIHDSVLFCYAKGYERHAESVRRIMEIPVTVRDVHGVVRTFTVPADLKVGVKDDNGQLKRAIYWSETE